MFTSLSQKILLYSSTKFFILNHWAIISNLIRFDWGFWQTSKSFYRKLKYRGKVLEEFQRLPRFPRKMDLYSWTNFCILKPSEIISNLIRFDLGFWQDSKPIYRKLEYTEKALEEFQHLRHFFRKMVLYSSTKFCILRPWAIISNLIRFDLGFWQASKQFYRKLEYWEKPLEDFQRFPRFARKMVLHSSTNFRFFKPWAIISSLIRFDLGFSLASKPFYRNLKYREKVLGVFQRQPGFPRKMVLYSSANFLILRPWGIISKLKRFNLGFWQASKPLKRKRKYRENVLEDFQRLPPFPRKMVFYSSTNFHVLKPWIIISNLIRFDLGFWQASKPFKRKGKYRDKVLEEFQYLPRSPRKMLLY